MNYRDVTRQRPDGEESSGESADLIDIAEGPSSIQASDDDDDDDDENEADAFEDDPAIEGEGYPFHYDGVGELEGR